jgi:hypothetical protein
MVESFVVQLANARTFAQSVKKYVSVAERMWAWSWRAMVW